MKFNVKVMPNSKRNSVVKEENMFKVHLAAQPVENKANKALIDVLAEFFKIKKNRVKIIRGEKARIKIIEIAD